MASKNENEDQKAVKTLHHFMQKTYGNIVKEMEHYLKSNDAGFRRTALWTKLLVLCNLFEVKQNESNVSAAEAADMALFPKKLERELLSSKGLTTQVPWTWKNKSAVEYYHGQLNEIKDLAQKLLVADQRENKLMSKERQNVRYRNTLYAMFVMAPFTNTNGILARLLPRLGQGIHPLPCKSALQLLTHLVKHNSKSTPVQPETPWIDYTDKLSTVYIDPLFMMMLGRITEDEYEVDKDHLVGLCRKHFYNPLREELGESVINEMIAKDRLLLGWLKFRIRPNDTDLWLEQIGQGGEGGATVQQATEAAESVAMLMRRYHDYYDMEVGEYANHWIINTFGGRH